MFTNQYTPFDELPDSAFVRATQLAKSTKRPSSISIFPFSHATLWRKVADGSFPKPVKLSSRVTAWRVGDVRDFMKAVSGEEVRYE